MTTATASPEDLTAPHVGVSIPLVLRVTLQPDGTILYSADANVSGDGSGPTGCGTTLDEALRLLAASVARHGEYDAL